MTAPVRSGGMRAGAGLLGPSRGLLGPSLGLLGPSFGLLVAACGPPQTEEVDENHPAEAVSADPAVAWPGAAAPVSKVLLVVIDTLRDDVARSSATPTLDGLAERGTWLDHTWSGGSWTVPSVVTLLTGMPVRQHGWDAPSARMGQYTPLPSVPTLPEVLAEAGWRCDGRYANPYLSEDLGFSRGFASWQRTPDVAMAKAVSTLVSAHWTDDSHNLAYVHLLGPHSPLKPSEAARARHGLGDPEHAHWFAGRHGFTVGQAKRNQEPGVRSAYAAAYAAVVEDTDRILAEVLEGLGRHREETLVIVTSDHGELLGEHAVVGHGWWLWQELLRVPMVVDHPALPPASERLPARLSNGSIASLITRAAGIPHDWALDLETGQVLIAQREGRAALSIDGRFKGIWDARIHAPGPAVFDLERDPSEGQPLPPGPAVASLEAAWLEVQERHPQRAAEAPTARLDAETQAALEVLGYVDAPSP